tara:strand:+ start:539 stop:814 length:276 start_codon:yes stop_codon:yes gene_type:complete
MKPVNRMLLVAPIDDVEEGMKPAFYMDYTDVATSKEFEIVSLLDASEDSKFINLLLPDTKLVVEGHMLRKIGVGDKIFYLVLENHVLGVLS